MGTFLNPGNQEYQMAVNSEIYIDKTPMINDLNQLVNTNQRFVSVSRPRRFGKTMAADMICSYYDREADSRPLFENKLITTVKALNGHKDLSWDAFLGRFDVVRIVMTRFFKNGISVEKSLSDMQKMVIRDIRKAYPEADYYNDSDLIQTIEDVYEFSKRQFIFVIDEWDVLIRVNITDKEGQKLYLDFLRDLFKDNKRIALAYMTGILPIKKYGQHSALNMFTEYSMMSPMRFAKYCGFTADEVRSLCKEYGRNYDKMKDWYDGYEVSETVPPDPNHEMMNGTGESPQANRYSIYSPLSVVESISTGQIKNYWNNTETYEALAEYIRRNFDGLKESVALLMDGGRVHIDTLSYQNDMTDFTCRDDVLSLLVHLGYLGFDDRTGEVFIPNREILDVFRTSTKTEEWASTFWLFDLSQETLKATWDRNEERVAELLERAHDSGANKTYNDEATLSYSIQLAYYAAQKYYTEILELDSGKGFADIVYIPSPKHSDKPVLLIELKYDKDVKTALAQIRERNYPARLEHYKGNILLVGIEYDKNAKNTEADFKHHKCKIEQA